MTTGELKRKVDRLCDAFSSGDISNPLGVTLMLHYPSVSAKWDKVLLSTQVRHIKIRPSQR